MKIRESRSSLIFLNIDFEILDDYIIKRPWHKVIYIHPINVLNLWNEKGILDNYNIINEILNCFFYVILKQ